jgi:HEAT repeat protein
MFAELLKQLCEDPNPDTRAAALEALRSCDRTSALVIASQWLAKGSEDWQVTAAAIDAFSDEGVPELVLSFLMNALDDPDEHIVASAARALSTRGESMYAPLVGELLDRADTWKAVRAAFQAMGDTGVDYLARRARRLDCSGDMRATIVLGTLDGPEAERTTAALCNDGDPLVRWSGVLASGAGGNCSTRAMVRSWSPAGPACSECSLEASEAADA